MRGVDEEPPDIFENVFIGGTQIVYVVDNHVASRIILVYAMASQYDAAF
jgi:hypothetical protein